MIEIIRRRHRECCETISLTDWEPEGGQAHVDRAELIRIVDALAAELAAARKRGKRMRDLISAMIDNHPDDAVSDGGHTMLDLWRHDARAALEQT